MTPVTTWKTPWGWRAKRIPGVFFPTQAAANDAYIAKNATDIVVTEAMLDELREILRDAAELEAEIDSMTI